MQFSSEIDLELGQLILLPLGEKKTFIAFLNSQFDAIFLPPVLEVFSVVLSGTFNGERFCGDSSLIFF